MSGKGSNIASTQKYLKKKLQRIFSRYRKFENTKYKLTSNPFFCFTLKTVKFWITWNMFPSKIIYIAKFQPSRSRAPILTAKHLHLLRSCSKSFDYILLLFVNTEHFQVNCAEISTFKKKIFLCFFFFFVLVSMNALIGFNFFIISASMT